MTLASLRCQFGQLDQLDHIFQLCHLGSPRRESIFGFVTYAQCRSPVSTLFAPRQMLLHMESVKCLDLLKIFSRNRKNRTRKEKKKTDTPTPHCNPAKTMTKVPVRLALWAECADATVHLCASMTIIAQCSFPRDIVGFTRVPETMISPTHIPDPFWI